MGKNKIKERSDPGQLIDIKLQEQLSGKSNQNARLLVKDDQFTINTVNRNICCLYQQCSAMTLSPYDVACMRKLSNLTSTEFFSKFGTLSFDEKYKFPRAFLDSNSSKRKKTCPFLVNVNGGGTDSRPLGCRLYPVIRIVDEQDVSHFALIESNPKKRNKSSKQFTLDYWIKRVNAGKWLRESNKHEYLVQTVVNQKGHTFTEREKSELASMLFTPEAFASNDLFGSYLLKSELAPEALEFGYSRAWKFIDKRIGTKVRK